MIRVYAALAVNPVVVNNTSPVGVPALLMRGDCPAFVKSQKPEPVRVTIVAGVPPPHVRVTLGDMVDDVPEAIDQNNLVMFSLSVPSPLAATSADASTFVILVSPVPSEMFVNLTANPLVIFKSL